MRLLVTGAFGNLGAATVRALVAGGRHQVRALSHRLERADRRLARRFGPSVEVLRGDVRDRAAMQAAVRGADAVVHLAFLIPPPALEQPELAESINVGGTRNLLDAAAGVGARFLFASTLDVYGNTQHLPPPRRVGDATQALDAYAAHKLTCETMVRESGLRATILRFADIPPIAVRRPHPMMFRLPPSTRIEVVHPDDAGLAVARALDCDEAWGRTLNIGGGARCQLTYREYLGAFLDAMGIGRLPDGAFSSEPYCTDWLDSDDSQRLLQYQRHDFGDIVRETAALVGWRRPLARLFRPLVRAALLRMSPHWRVR
jgi:nucleoside-diphosphate-sugar epimerase